MCISNKSYVYQTSEVYASYATVTFAIYLSSSYINVLPFVLVFGIATSLTALHRALPYHVSSKVNIQVFSSQPSTTYLNSVVEHVFFAEDFPFRLGRKVFNLFTDVFLFYDLSVTGFIKNCKVSRCVSKVWYFDHLCYYAARKSKFIVL